MAYEMNYVCYYLFRYILGQQSLVYNYIASYDHFIGSDLGLKHIIYSMFKISNPVYIEATEVVVDGKKRVIKSMYIEVIFYNAYIESRSASEEEIRLFYQKNVGYPNYGEETQTMSAELQKMKYYVSDTVIPYEARLFGKSLKLDVMADVLIKLQSYSEEMMGGEVVYERIERMVRQNIAYIPLMVGSKYCMTSNKTKEQLIELGEDPLDLGGYFILKSNEWSIDFVESIKMNELYLRNEPKKRLIRGFVISKDGDTYQASFYTDITYKYKDNYITLCIKEYERLDVEVPFYVIFKMFDITNEVDMVEMIIQDDVSSLNAESYYLQRLIYAACDAYYPHFEEAKNWLTTDYVLENMASLLNQDWVKRKAVDSVIYYSPQRVKDAYMQHLFPHVGNTSYANDTKMRFLGDYIRKILLAYRDNTLPDKHTYLEKRIHATGQNLAKKFKKTFNYQVIKPLRTNMITELRRSRNLQSIDVIQMVANLLTTNINNKMMQKSIVSGQTASSGKSADYGAKNRIQSQKIMRKNIVNSVATMRMITNSKLSRDKQSTKIVEQRSVQPSFAGYICPVQSSDNGEKAGKVKSLTSLSRITNAHSSEEVIEMVWDVVGDHIYQISVFESRDVRRFGLKKVIVNGFWIAYVPVKKLYQVADLLRQHRRQNTHQWYDVTVYINEYLELFVYSDFGRILNPLILVHYDANDVPYTNLTPYNVEHILSGKARIEWLLEEQIIEYISVEEAHNCLIAENPAAFVRQLDPEVIKNKQQRCKYTHILIPQSLIGIVALLSPFGNHAQTKRITMFTNQAKQSCGWAMYNFPYRMDKGLMVYQYCSQPIVRTVMNDFFPPNCQQVVVAYMVYDGFNYEDSVIFNKGSIDQGMFNGYYYTYEECQVRYNEFIDAITGIQPPNVFGNYTKLKNGIIPKGVWVQKGDVLVAKKEQSRGMAAQVTSMLYSYDEPGFVEDIIYFQDEQYHTTIRVKVKIVRSLKQGDKLSAGQGCKSIISKVLTPAEMPFTADGIMPDIIFNPHSIPTRLLTGQIIEASFQRLAVDLCDFVDATMFNDVSVEELYLLYKKHGIEDHGYVDMYNGYTGERMTARVFVAPTNYMRLQKFSITAKYVVNQGKTDSMTRQLVGSRSMGGGQRCGELEVVSIFASGTATTLQEKTFGCSDGESLIVCTQCGNLADYNPESQYRVYDCPVCKDKTHLAKVNSAWSYNLFAKTLQACNIGVSLELEPPVMEVNE